MVICEHVDPKLAQKYTTVEPRYNDLRYNDIPGITTNNRLPSKSCSKMYGTEPRYNDLRYNQGARKDGRGNEPVGSCGMCDARSTGPRALEGKNRWKMAGQNKIL